MDVDCGYCYDRIRTDDFLECEECEQYVHVRCLRRPGTPGDFVGDVFFKFTCCSCTDDHKETFVREKLPWTILIVLAIHNLTKKSQGLSHHGYFHWRTHIAHFIDKNWSYLMETAAKRRKNWIGTVSGALSHNSPTIFTSGFNVINEAGWWKLTHNKNPKQYYELVKRLRREKGTNEEVDVMNISPEPSVLGKRSHELTDDEVEDEPEIFSRTLPYMGRYPLHLKQKEEKIDLLDFMDLNNDSSLLDEMPVLSSQDISSVIPSFTTASNDNEELSSQLLELDFDIKPSITDDYKDDDDNEAKYEPRIVQITNFQDAEESQVNLRADVPVDVKKEVVSDTEEPNHDDNEEEPYEIKYACEQSLFKHTPRIDIQPWEMDMAADRDDDDTDDFTGDKNIELLSEYEENETYKRLKAIFAASQLTNAIKIPAWIRRHHRKLCVRKLQRSLGKPVFNLDNYQKHKITNNKTNKNNLVLDRFHHLISSSGNFSTGCKENDSTFLARLAGSCQHELFVSPHTERVLHPFIYRNDSCVPTWVKLMCELQYEVNGEMPSRASIDYCYVRPQHIAAVNALLQRMFWPGIDMSECLSYPDFSVVALYKKLIVGCAFLVPDVGHNEAYVSFMAVRPGWQRAGIATFMLYHLTQTCMGKDFTLHVSATNPAICLYQKFGFKIEEMILDFYEKFLPTDSSQSRHAFFLRLER